MKKALSLLLSMMLCLCLLSPVPAAHAEQNNVTIYSMLLFLIQSFEVQPTAAYDVTDMLTGSDMLEENETVIAFMQAQDWVLLSGLNASGVYTATVYAYEDASYLVLMRAVAETYPALQTMTTRPEERLVIELSFEDGTIYAFDSPEDAAALVDMLTAE